MFLVKESFGSTKALQNHYFEKSETLPLAQKKEMTPNMSTTEGSKASGLE